MKYFNETYIKRKFLTRNEWADTYKAIHATTEEKVILKVLVRKSNDEEYINKLLKEVEVLKNIKNPNLIHVNHMFKYSGCGKTYYYIEGEYFKGISLEEKLANGKFEEKEAIKTFETIAEGLKEFHNRKILFNNLSLKNIIINSKDEIKIDILSHLEKKEFILHEEDENIEEIRFNPQKDIYDLGIVLYSLLTGKIDFDSNNYKKEIPNKNLVSIIEKAINDNVENKYKSINRFILDIKSYLRCGELSNETYEEKEENTDKKKRKKGKVGKTLGVCAAIVIVGGALVYGYDLFEKSNIDDQTNTTKVEESAEPKEEDVKVDEDKEEKTEEKTSENNHSTSNSNKNNSSSSNSKKNNSLSNNSTNSNKNNNSSSNSSNNNSSSNSSGNNNSNSNNTSKPSKPNNNASSGNTSSKPDEGNNKEEQTPEVTPPSNDSNDDNNSSSENTTPESPSTEAEGE